MLLGSEQGWIGVGEAAVLSPELGMRGRGATPFPASASGLGGEMLSTAVR